MIRGKHAVQLQKLDTSSISQIVLAFNCLALTRKRCWCTWSS